MILIFMNSIIYNLFGMKPNTNLRLNRRCSCKTFKKRTKSSSLYSKRNRSSSYKSRSFSHSRRSRSSSYKNRSFSHSRRNKSSTTNSKIKVKKHSGVIDIYFDINKIKKKNIKELKLNKNVKQLIFNKVMRLKKRRKR
jgi:hypothetical protein